MQQIEGGVDWYGANNITFSTVTDTTTGWTEMTASGVAPGGVTNAYVNFEGT